MDSLLRLFLLRGDSRESNGNTATENDRVRSRLPSPVRPELVSQRGERTLRVHGATADEREQRVHVLQIFIADFEVGLVKHDEIRELADLDRAHVLLFEVE